TSDPAGPNGSHTSLPSVKPRNATGESSAAKCMVEFSPTSDKVLKDYRPLTPRPIYGTLGLIAVNDEVFIAVITQASRAATVRPVETVERIGNVAFYCLSSANYDDVVPLDPYETDLPDPQLGYNQASTYGQNLGRRDVVMEHP